MYYRRELRKKAYARAVRRQPALPDRVRRRVEAELPTEYVKFVQVCPICHADWLIIQVIGES